jgi:PTS system ascorbate-specific IIA component
VSAVAGDVGVAAADWRAAVRAAAGLLVREGAAEAGYPDRCVATVEEQGPYIVLAPGLALAHARPEDGALSVGVAAATLAEPVAFGHPVNDPVDVVLAFCTPDAAAHTATLAALARALQGGLADDLRAAGDPEAVGRALREALA